MAKRAGGASRDVFRRRGCWNNAHVGHRDVEDLPDESRRVGCLDRVFTVLTLTGRVLFVLFVLSHHRRRILHANITAHPTAEWAAQQVVEAFPDDTAPRWLHRDRDRIYVALFQRRVSGMGIAEVVSAPASPWQNPYVERVIVDPPRMPPTT